MRLHRIHAKSFRFLYANYSKALEVGTGRQGRRGRQGRCKERGLKKESLKFMLRKSRPTRKWEYKHWETEMPSSLIQAVHVKKAPKFSEQKLLIN